MIYIDSEDCSHEVGEVTLYGSTKVYKCLVNCPSCARLYRMTERSHDVAVEVERGMNIDLAVQRQEERN